MEMIIPSLQGIGSKLKVTTGRPSGLFDEEKEAGPNLERRVLKGFVAPGLWSKKKAGLQGSGRQ